MQSVGLADYEVGYKGTNPQSKASVVPALFVDQTRLDELKAIKSPHFDLTRLIKLCEELNVCSANKCWLAVSALTRTLIDHIPPIFDQSHFSGVANNYGGGKSFMKSMQHLEKSLKPIADRNLHQQIRKTETLPNRTQLNFSTDLDVLLEKIVEILK